MSIQIDARGQNCPIPVVKAKQAIDAGEREILVVVDNNTAVENLQRLADSHDFRTTVESDGGSIYRVSFVKAEGVELSARELGAAEPAAPNSDWTVLVGADMMGRGDPELGRSLIKMYFYTLAQGGELPASIVFLNAGVKLPTLDDQIAEHLRALAARGVEILVCGTCLNFYSLTDRLQVGTVSNMYDISQRMQRVGKVISL